MPRARPRPSRAVALDTPRGHRAVTRIATLAITGIGRAYPSRVAHVLRSARDARPPRALTPVFYGCYDWHSAVHAHWVLARVMRLAHAGVLGVRGAELGRRAHARLVKSLQRRGLAAELAYLNNPGRESFERPYGLAWLLTLAREVRGLAHAGAKDAIDWVEALQGLEELAARRLVAWVEALPSAIRTGTHDQSAFSMSLALDWAMATDRADIAGPLRAHALRLHGGDHDAPIHLEPSGHDFLSPSLAVADLMRRVLPRTRYSRFLDAWLPGLRAPRALTTLAPPKVIDERDGHLVHQAGLCSSRAWMAKAVAESLDAADPRRRPLISLASTSAAAGLRFLSTEHYAGTHWLGTFALYLLAPPESWNRR